MKCESCGGEASPATLTTYVIAEKYLAAERYVAQTVEREYRFRNFQEFSLAMCEPCFWKWRKRSVRKVAIVLTLVLFFPLAMLTLGSYAAASDFHDQAGARWALFSILLLCTLAVPGGIVMSYRSYRRRDPSVIKLRSVDALYSVAKQKMKAAGCNELHTPQSWARLAAELKDKQKTREYDRPLRREI
jgi:hypothetical protein